MKYTRVFADEKGETHFEDVEVELELVDFAPPASPLMLSRFNPATRYAFCMFPSGWFGDWHPTPRKQFFFGLSGEYEVKVSDGESRVFGPGSVVLVEDVAGKGHVTRAVGSEGVLTAIVQLED
jgi:mannose-6-phosphate isomerase-like protein (cupin superfamily)